MSPRRSHRACHRRRLPHQIRLSCLNVQNMNWTVDLYRNMLYGIVERMRNESTECMFLSELGTPSWIQTKKVSLVCVEEYLAFVRGKVGLILSRSMVKAWRQAGERTRFVEDNDRWLGVDVVLNGKQCTLDAAYAPTQSSAASTNQRAYFFEEGNELLNMCQETIICGGDFNSHIGRTEELRMSEEEYEEEEDEVVNETVGKHRLNTPTTGKSKQFVEWLPALLFEQEMLEHVQQREVREDLGKVPDDTEILEAMKQESAAGLDEVSIGMLTSGGANTTRKVCAIVKKLWVQAGAGEMWEEQTHAAIVMMPHKGKGDRADPDKYRGICLLTIISRITAKVAVRRIAGYAEQETLLNNAQWGFRRGRSTRDAIITLRMMAEMCADHEERCRQKIESLEKQGGAQEEIEEMKKTMEDNRGMVQLIDIQKAYPNFSRELAWQVLRKHGLPENLVRVVSTLHEDTVYEVRDDEYEIGEIQVTERLQRRLSIIVYHIQFGPQRCCGGIARKIGWNQVHEHKSFCPSQWETR